MNKRIQAFGWPTRRPAPEHLLAPDVLAEVDPEEMADYLKWTREVIDGRTWYFAPDSRPFRPARPGQPIIIGDA